MEKERAIEVIKQIMEACSFKAVVLDLYPNNNLSNGCQIRLELINESAKSCIETITKSNNLKIRNAGKQLIIYKPK